MQYECIMQTKISTIPAKNLSDYIDKVFGFFPRSKSLKQNIGPW